MAALTAARNTTQSGSAAVNPNLSWPVKASTKCYGGGIVVGNAGYAAPGTTALGLGALGIAAATADNSSGANGDITVSIIRGSFWLKNSAAADAIAQANLPCPCFIVDDQTVALTDGNAARSLAGTALGVDTNLGVLVEIGMGALASAAGIDETSPVGSWVLNIPAMSGLANAATYGFTPGFAGRIIRTSFVSTTAVTTVSKAATITPKIAGVAVTGGVLALTSANITTTVGTEVTGTAVTALNTFTAAQQITLVVSAVTAFVEGAGQLTVVFG